VAPICGMAAQGASRRRQSGRAPHFGRDRAAVG